MCRLVVSSVWPKTRSVGTHSPSDRINFSLGYKIRVIEQKLQTARWGRGLLSADEI